MSSAGSDFQFLRLNLKEGEYSSLFEVFESKLMYLETIQGEFAVGL